jgi:(2R)-ethylmalonyl-CoA mutase
VPVVVGGIIPDDDRASLMKAGVAAVYTPKDYAVARIMSDIVDIVERHRAAAN